MVLIGKDTLLRTMRQHGTRTTSPCRDAMAKPRAQITKLKLVKRQLYSRGKPDILQRRVMGSG